MPYALLALVIAGLYWIDPLFVPLALLGPIVTGIIAGRRGVGRQVALAWLGAGLIALVSDWAIHNEDQVFHLALSLWTAGVALAASAIAAAVHSRADGVRNGVPRVHRQTAGR
jgi:hypothetical protein